MDSKSALKELKKAQSTRKGAGDYYNKYQQELGVNDVKTRADDMRGLIRNTETALKGVPEAVSGRTRGQLVTEAQRARLSNLEQQPLAEQLSGLQGGYSDEMQSYRDLLGQAGTQTQFAYQNDADKLAALEGNYNRIFQKETAAAEEARWRKQMAEETRRFNAQLAQSARLQAETDAMTASINSLLNQANKGGGGGGGKPANVKKEYKDKTGQVTGYETDRQSVLTDYGKQLNDQLLRKENPYGWGDYIGDSFKQSVKFKDNFKKIGNFIKARW